MTEPNFKDLLYDLCCHLCHCETQGDILEAIQAVMVAARFATQDELSEYYELCDLSDFLEDYRDEELSP